MLDQTMQRSVWLAKLKKTSIITLNLESASFRCYLAAILPCVWCVHAVFKQNTRQEARGSQLRKGSKTMVRTSHM